MKLFLEFFPLALFFGAYKYFDNMVPATGVLMAATILQLLLFKLTTGSIPKTQLYTAILIVVFGSLTLAMNDSAFIQHKPTLLYSTLAIVAVASNFFGKQPFMEKAMGANMPAPTEAWRKATYAIAAFFALSAAANHFVATRYSEDVWINFKLFGMLGATFIFTMAIAAYLYQQVPADKREELFQD